MRITHIFANPLHDQFDQESNSLDELMGNDDQGFGMGNKDFPMGFGIPGMQHVMQVYLMPAVRAHEESSWRVAGMAMLVIAVVLAGLLIFYFCAVRCCCKQKTPEAEDEESADDTPSSVRDDHRVSLPTDLPPLGVSEKHSSVPASFLESPTLNISQPYQAEPEDLARMQEVMLAQLEAPHGDWEMGHGDLDTKPLY